jgi:hypothetical protein
MITYNNRTYACEHVEGDYAVFKTARPPDPATTFIIAKIPSGKTINRPPKSVLKEFSTKEDAILALERMTRRTEQSNAGL